MFGNPGLIIKILSYVFFGVEMAALSVYSLITMILADGRGAIIALFIFFAGALGAWISNLLLYAFGELVHNSSKIAADIDD